MNDDVKAALARYRATMADERAQMDEGTFNALWGDDALILAHIDGEATRHAAAVAAAREEQREACAQNFPKSAGESLADPWAAELVRATPLTSQPLADRIAELECERVGNHLVSFSAYDVMSRAERDRDALRASWREAVEVAERNAIDCAHLRHSAVALEAERDRIATSLAHAAGVDVETTTALSEKVALDLVLARKALEAERDALKEELDLMFRVRDSAQG